LDANPALCRRTDFVEKNLTIEDIESEMFFFDLFEVIRRTDLTKAGIEFSRVMEKLIQVNKYVEHYAELLEYVKEKGVLEQYSGQIMESFAEDFDNEIADCSQEFECEQVESSLNKIADLIADFDISGYMERVQDRKVMIREEEDEKRDSASTVHINGGLQNDISDRQLEEMFSSLLCESNSR